MVECDLAKVEVAGSTPVSRSIILLAVAPRPGEGLCSQGGHSDSGRGTQVVRERSAKPLCVGSIPTRASNTLKNDPLVSPRKGTLTRDLPAATHASLV